MDITGILITVILLGVIAVIWMYNRLVRNRNLVSEAWAGIDVQLQKRFELVPNLVQTVKGYAKHESSVFEEVAHIRNTGETRVDARAKQETALSRSLGRLFALAEDYPDLKADANFRVLQEELANTEDRIAAARRFFNGNVREMRDLREAFPTSIVGGMMGIKEPTFFEIDDDNERSVPRVSV